MHVERTTSKLQWVLNAVARVVSVLLVATPYWLLSYIGWMFLSESCMSLASWCLLPAQSCASVPCRILPVGRRCCIPATTPTSPTSIMTATHRWRHAPATHAGKTQRCLRRSTIVHMFTVLRLWLNKMHYRPDSSPSRTALPAQHLWAMTFLCGWSVGLEFRVGQLAGFGYLDDLCRHFFICDLLMHPAH